MNGRQMMQYRKNMILTIALIVLLMITVEINSFCIGDQILGYFGITVYVNGLHTIVVMGAIPVVILSIILVFQLKKSNIIFVRKGSLLSEIMSTIVKLILIILVIGVIGWNLVL